MTKTNYIAVSAVPTSSKMEMKEFRASDVFNILHKIYMPCDGYDLFIEELGNSYKICIYKDAKFNIELSNSDFEYITESMKFMYYLVGDSEIGLFSVMLPMLKTYTEKYIDCDDMYHFTVYNEFVTELIFYFNIKRRYTEISKEAK